MAKIDNELNKIKKELEDIQKELKMTSGDLVESFDLTSAKKEVKSLLVQIEQTKSQVSSGFLNETEVDNKITKINNKFTDLLGTINEIKKEAAFNAKGTFFNIDDVGDVISDSTLDDLASKYTELRDIVNNFSIIDKTIKDDAGKIIGERSLEDRLGTNFKIIPQIFPELGKIIEDTSDAFSRLAGLKGVFTKSDIEGLQDIVDQGYTGSNIDVAKEKIIDLKKELSDITGVNFLDDYEKAIDELNNKDLNVFSLDQLTSIDNLQSRIEDLQKIIDNPVNFSGFIKMYNELNNTLNKYNTYKEAIETAFASAQFNGNNVDRFKAEVEEVFKSVELENPVGKIKDAKDQNQILEEIAKNQEKIDELNKKYNNTNLTNEYLTDEKILDTEKKRKDNLEEIKRLQKDVASISINRQEADEDLSDSDIEYYKKEVNDAIVKGNELRENIISIQNAINSGNVSSVFGLHKTVEDLAELASKPHRQNIISNEGIDNAEKLEKLVNTIIKEVGNINTEIYDNNLIDKLNQQNKFIGAANYRKEFQAVNDVLIQKNYKDLKQASYLADRIRDVLNRKPIESNGSEFERLETDLIKLDSIISDNQQKINKLKNEYEKFNIDIPVDTTVLDKTENILERFKQVNDKGTEKTPYGKLFGDLEKAQGEIDKYTKIMLRSIDEYVAKQEALSGKKMPLQQQLDYYRDALSKFQEGSEEYIIVLKKVRSVEQQIDATRNKAYQQVLSTVQSFVNGVANAMNKILSIIRRTVSMIIRLLKSGFNILTKLGSTIKRIIQLFGNFGNRVKGVQLNGNILKGTFTELKSKIDLLVGAYEKLFNNDYINNGRKLLQSIQTLNITLGKDLTTNTIRWSKELERAFGISAAGLIADLQGINAVLYGMGMNSQSTELAGRNLLAVGQTLAGITGYNLDTVLEKIESGMKGMTQSIDDLGLSVRESEMNAFLENLKKQGGEFSSISTKFQSLTEQQRVYVRYAALMTQFRRQFDAEDYVRSLDSITGRLLVLESRFRSLKTTIGNFALQLLDKITIPLASFITFIENRIKALAKLFGIDLEISSGMNKTADGAEKASKNLRNVNNELNDIEETADKAKGSLDAFDHISNISSSDNGSGSPFDYSKLLTIAPDYAQELEDIAKLQDNWLDEQIKKFKEKIKQFIDDIKQKISTWWKDLTGRVINWDEITDNLKKAWSNIKQIFANIKDIAKELFDIIAGLVGMILDDLNFTQLLVDITGLFVSITNFIKEFLATVKPILFDFYEKYLRKYVLKFGVWLHNTILKWTAYFDNLTAWARSEKGKKDIDNWFDNLGKHIDDLVIKFKAIGRIIQTVFVGEGNAFKDEYTDNGMHQKKSRQQKYAEYDQAGFSRDYIEVADSLNGVFSGLLKVVQDIGRNIAELWNTPDTGGLAQLKDTLERISTLLNEKHDSLARTITNIVLAINDIKQAILDEILDILEWIAANPDLVEKALDAIVKTLSFLIDNITVIVGLIGVAKLGAFILKLLTIYTTLTNISKITASLTGASAGAGFIKALTGAIQGLLAKLTAAGAGISGFITALIGAVQGLLAVLLPLATGIAGIAAGFNLARDNIAGAIMEIKNFYDSIRGEAVMSNETVEENAEKMINGLKEKYGEHIPLTGMNQALTEYNNLLVETGNFTQEKVDDYVGYAEKMIIKTGDVYDDTSTSMENTTKRLSERIDESKITISDYESTYKKANNNIKSSNVESQKSITKTTSNITELLKKVTKLASYATNPIKLLVDIQGNMINTGVEKVKNFFGHANGGVPSKGSIFMANENGMPELVSNFGGYTGVANQKMILEAMQNAIGSSMYDAVSSAMNNGGNSQPVNIEICKQGMFVGDDSTVRKLAQKIENVLVTSNKNIGNTRFNFN